MRKRALLMLAGAGVLAGACGSVTAPGPVQARHGSVRVVDQMYIAAVDPGRSVVIPVALPGRTPGQPIKVGDLPTPGTPAVPEGLPRLVVTPDGRTVYATDGGWNFHPTGVHNVIPISTASNRPGKPIPLSNPADVPNGQFSYDQLMAITADGRTVLATDGASPVIIPIDTATNTAGAPITVGKAGDEPSAIAVTPDSRIAYAVEATTVVPVDLATRSAGKPIRVGPTGQGIVITPDGATAYVVGGDRTIIPIDIATNTAGRPITVAPPGPHFLAIAITPDGSTVYVSDGRLRLPGLVPVSTATRTAGRPITAIRGPVGMAFTPDGKTAFIGNDHALYALSTATNTVIAIIKLQGVVIDGIAVAGDGRIAWVSGFRNTAKGDAVLVPISTTTYRAGTPITADRNAIAGCILPVPSRSGGTSC